MPEQQRQIERRGGGTEPMVHHYPEVRAGVCEWCGIKDDKQPSVVQYKLCPHYSFLNGADLQCSYCDPSKDPNEVIRSHSINVYNSPYNPTEVVVVCDDYECTRKHRERFKVS